MSEATSFSASHFLHAIEMILSDPAGQFQVPSLILMANANDQQISEATQKVIGDKPELLDQLGSITGYFTSSGPTSYKDGAWIDVMPSGSFMTMFTALFTHQVRKAKHNNLQRDISRLLCSFTISRNRAGLSTHEVAIVRAMAALRADGALPAAAWDQFIANFCWKGGEAVTQLPAALAHHAFAPTARNLLKQILDMALPPYQQFLEKTVKFVADHKSLPGPLGKAIREAISSGARWFSQDDLPNSSIFTDKASRSTLLIGRMPGGKPLYFEGETGLISIGGPGTGKSQGQVIPNLLNYPGSCFVLDVKGELWRTTAAERAKRYGRVYKFAPADLDFQSHCFNPFDLISTEPNRAGVQCQRFAESLIPENPNDKDKFWDNNARVYVWAFAMLVALDDPPEDRNISTLVRYLNFETGFEKERERFLQSQTYILLSRLVSLATRCGNPALADIGNNIANSVQTTPKLVSSVTSTAMSHLAQLFISPMAAAAMAKSDWHPTDLHTKTGTTVYLTFPPGGYRAYSSIIRLIFQQHVMALAERFERREAPPITFFLDEFPQLGEMPALNDLMDVGRGAGIRMWLFAQNLGQIRDIYDKRADGLVGSTQVRCFMQPDNEAATYIAPLLGDTVNFLTKEERPLATPHQLNTEYGNNIICVPRNERPVLLEPILAIQHVPEILSQPPPVVPTILKIMTPEMRETLLKDPEALVPDAVTDFDLELFADNDRRPPAD